MADVEQVTPQQSLPSQLRSAEQHWIWKVSLRAVICVINIVAIGCTAWVVANSASIDSNPYIGYFEFEGSSVGALLALSLSFVWCALCISIPFLLKPPRAIHPGAAVGVDLILWLAFIVVGLFSVAGVISIIQFGSDPTYLADPTYGSGYQGNYYLAPNNTWVYNVTYATGDGSYHYNATLGEYVYNTGDVNNVTRDCSPQFTSCAQQDADINILWREKSRREGTEIVTTAVLWLDVLLHFVLFVWACIDTHKRKSGRNTKKEQIIADKVMADLEKRGLLVMYNQDPRSNGGTPQPQMMQTQYPATQTSLPNERAAMQQQTFANAGGYQQTDTISPVR